MNGLTNEEISILLEVLDAWVNGRTSGEFMGDILYTIMGKDTDENKMKIEERRRESKREQQLDADVATLLKAKLIQIRQKQIA